mgnify:CR=1 FL=1
MKKKNVKTSIVILLMVVAGIAYYYYLSNRTPSVDATQQAVDNQELGDLLSRLIIIIHSRLKKLSSFICVLQSSTMVII